MKRAKEACKTLGLLILMSIFPIWAFAQNTVTITGLVTDDDGPIIGATVKVKGSTTGAITDLDGKYTLKVSPGSVVTFTYLGYADKEVKVTNQKEVNVKLEPDSKMLDEVVAIGYGTMKRSDVTGSMVSINDKAIEQTVSTSIDQVLQGRRFRQTQVLLVPIQVSAYVVSTLLMRPTSLYSSSTVLWLTHREQTATTPCQVTTRLPASTRATSCQWMCSRMPLQQPSMVQERLTVSS